MRRSLWHKSRRYLRRPQLRGCSVSSGLTRVEQLHYACTRTCTHMQVHRGVMNWCPKAASWPLLKVSSLCCLSGSLDFTVVSCNVSDFTKINCTWGPTTDSYTESSWGSRNSIGVQTITHTVCSQFSDLWLSTASGSPTQQDQVIPVQEEILGIRQDKAFSLPKTWTIVWKKSDKREHILGKPSVVGSLWCLYSLKRP